MRRGFALFMVGWMMLLTVWTVLLSIGVFDGGPASIAYADSPALDVRDPIVVRYESYSEGECQELLPPETMPVWQYIQGGDQEVADGLTAFEKAFEEDLHGKDPTFHLTHELIDGKEW